MRISLITVPMIHILLYFVIAFNIPIVRQIVVFMYLSFIPGFVVLKILNLKKTNMLDVILFSVGLSISFLMFVGWAISELSSIVGVSYPLSTLPLEVSLSLPTLVLFFVGYRQDLRQMFSSPQKNVEDLRSTLMKSSVLFLPAFLGTVGALFVSVPSISVPLLLLMFLAIAFLFAISFFSRKFISSNLYPLVIFAISLALIFQVVFVSRYIIGSDANLEYFVFKLTTSAGSWHPLSLVSNSAQTVNYNSMLSITVLPAIYFALMNINGEMVFKTLYPFVFSLVPVVLYKIYEKQIGMTKALLSALFFISSPLVFYTPSNLSLDRQMVAEFFFVLSIFILLDDKISLRKRRLLFIVFGAALAVSHYSTMYLYLAYVTSLYVVSKIKGEPDRLLDASTLLSLFIMTFLWYNFTVSPLTSFAQSLYTIITRFTSDLSRTAASSAALLTPTPTPSVASAINWILFYTVDFLIVLGILVLLLQSRKTKIDSRFRLISILSALLLFLCFAIPNLAPQLNFTRFYALSYLFLAPCFVLGGNALANILAAFSKKLTHQHSPQNTNSQVISILLCILLVGYFLSQSGFVNFIAGASPLGFSLNISRIITSNNQVLKGDLYGAYIPEQNVFSAVWLSGHGVGQSTVYADWDSYLNVLNSYGMIPQQNILLLTNSTSPERYSFIYLSLLNVESGVIASGGGQGVFNTSEISLILNESNLIYSNGEGEIWLYYR